jgi:polyphosphate kinase
MHRNIYERVEVMFHLRNPDLCNQVFTEVIEPYLADTEKTRLLESDGKYVRANASTSGKKTARAFPFNVQEFLIGFAESREGLSEVPRPPAFLKLPAIGKSASLPKKSNVPAPVPK